MGACPKTPTLRVMFCAHPATLQLGGFYWYSTVLIPRSVTIVYAVYKIWLCKMLLAWKHTQVLLGNSCKTPRKILDNSWKNLRASLQNLSYHLEYEYSVKGYWCYCSLSLLGYFCCHSNKRVWIHDKTIHSYTIYSELYMSFYTSSTQ